MSFWDEKELEAIETLENVPRETLISYLTSYRYNGNFSLESRSILKIYLAYCDLENYYSNVEIQVRTWRGCVRAVLRIEDGTFFGSKTIDISIDNGTDTKEKRAEFGRKEIKKFLFTNGPTNNKDKMLYEKVFSEIIDKIPLLEYPF